MPTGDGRPNWSERLPERGPGDVSPIADDEEPVYAFYLATIRVEVDSRSQEVIEVIVDEGTMEQPTFIARSDGRPIIGADRDRIGSILSRAEWPTWDYGSAKHGPTAPERPARPTGRVDPG